MRILRWLWSLVTGRRRDSNACRQWQRDEKYTTRVNDGKGPTERKREP